jgi:8-oxo-dGTP diphosphatase
MNSGYNKAMRHVTLLFLRNQNQVLLGTKKIGFGRGKLVAIGGHLEPKETPAQAVTREFFEETSVVVDLGDVQQVATVDFIFPAQPAWNMHATIFEAWTWQGDPLESFEIQPEWVDVHNLPLERMWDDAQHWVPALLLEQKRFHAIIEYQADNATVEKVRLE